MPALVSWVDRRLQVTVVGLAGVLDAGSTADAGSILWEYLAEMPNAVVIDGAELVCDADGWQWLSELHGRAATWPGAQMSLAGAPSPTEPASMPSFSTVDSALAFHGETALGERLQVALPPDPASCGHARDLVARACDDWGLRRLKRLAELLISELVANGVKHARTDLVVTVRLRGESLELNVRDHNPQALPAPQADPRGFGLQLVDQLSHSWGWVPAGRGKVVWSRLPGIN